jgi:hypothetical protein
MGDEQEIRSLIEGWAEAVHGGDLDRVLAAHADDLVMFDVPPPYQGVRGLAAYAETWPPFFTWQADGGTTRSPTSPRQAEPVVPAGPVSGWSGRASTAGWGRSNDRPPAR